jgi:hypothetical protein
MVVQSVPCEVGAEFLDITYINFNLQRVYTEMEYIPYCFNRKSFSTALRNVLCNFHDAYGRQNKQDSTFICFVSVLCSDSLSPMNTFNFSVRIIWALGLN